MNRTTASALLAVALIAAACGDADATTDQAEPDGSGVSAMCLEGATDCVDTPLTGPADPDAIDEGQLIREAEELLGTSEDDALAADHVRLGRHGDESMMLTDDQVVGRRTIATEEDGTGTFRVVEVTLELTDGPHVLSSSN